MLDNINEENLTTEELINSIFQHAFEERASDIHLEPYDNKMYVRFRIDGTLYVKYMRPLYELESTLTRIKVLSNLDITSHPLPQDGHFELAIDHSTMPIALPKEKKTNPVVGTRLTEKLVKLIGGEERADTEMSAETDISAKEESPVQTRSIDVRVSIFPTINGEAAVMRILNRSDMVFEIDALGMDPKTLQKTKEFISKSYGMVLVTGPSGSGKTTMLYSILQELNTKEKNIVTLEDPVEFHFREIRQIEIKPEHGFTFAVGMRSILRQDPDVIMVGEIRDHDTAEHAVRASLTGRAVFSTVHSNTTIGTIARLLDMDVERSLIAYALNGVISKRLLKTICNSCKTTYTPAAEYLHYFDLEAKGHQFVKGAGCKECGGTGYRGRTGIFEVLEFDNNLRSLIIEKSPMNVLQEYAEKAGMRTLKQDAIEKALEGITTLEEAAKAV